MNADFVAFSDRGPSKNACKLAQQLFIEGVWATIEREPEVTRMVPCKLI